MDVSVVVPCTDRVLGFERCLKSILAQTTNMKFEVIVVENNSSDKSVIQDKINEINDDRLKHFYLGDCDNANVARNYGVKKSTGEYVAFCDSDDELHKKINLLIDIQSQMDIKKRLNSRSELLKASSEEMWETVFAEVEKPRV